MKYFVLAKWNQRLKSKFCCYKLLNNNTTFKSIVTLAKKKEKEKWNPYGTDTKRAWIARNMLKHYGSWRHFDGNLTWTYSLTVISFVFCAHRCTRNKILGPFKEETDKLVSHLKESTQGVPSTMKGISENTDKCQ